MPHIHEKVDFTVEVFVVYMGKVLLRKHDKYKFWLSIGGHIELDEDPNQAAVREVKEEVGLDVRLYDNVKHPNNTETFKELIAPVFLNRHKINDNHEHVSLIYFANASSDKIKLSEREKTEECKWFTRDELIKNREGIKEEVVFYALMALDKLSL